MQNVARDAILRIFAHDHSNFANACHSDRSEVFKAADPDLNISAATGACVADTRQIVYWALEFTCPLRSGDAVSDPNRANAAIQRAHLAADHFHEMSSESGLLRDACVTSCIMESVPSELTHNDRKKQIPNSPGVPRKSAGATEYIHFPSGGFLISRELDSVGGVQGLISMCRYCPANASLTGPAECAGILGQSPDSSELEKSLRFTIDRLGLQRDVEDVVLPTNPLWFGFWAKSPLSDRVSDLIGIIFDDMIRQFLPRQSMDSLRLGAFARAAKIARDRHLPLHASMTPPGHTDFGHYTIFAHCPRCKAEANIERWQRRYPMETHACHVCGWNYSPAATTSSESYDEEEPSLRDILGERFPEFARSYLANRGSTLENAQRIVKIADDREAEIAKKAAISEARSKRVEAYIQTVVHAGFHPTRLQDSNDHGDLLFFRPDEFLMLLQRSRRLGVNVVSMLHESVNDDLCLSSSKCQGHAEAVFQSWRDKGCDEWFAAWIGVPDVVLDGRPDRIEGE
jgi:rubredoxin